MASVTALASDKTLLFGATSGKTAEAATSTLETQIGYESRLLNKEQRRYV